MFFIHKVTLRHAFVLIYLVGSYNIHSLCLSLAFGLVGFNFLSNFILSGFFFTC